MTRFSHPRTPRLLEIMEHNGHKPSDKVMRSIQSRRALTSVILAHHDQEPIDVFYVMCGGTSEQRLIEHLIDPAGTGYLPGASKPAEWYRRYLRGWGMHDEGLSPDHVALIVDDRWNHGTVMRQSIGILEQRGYDIDRMYTYHGMGDGSAPVGGCPRSTALGIHHGYPALLPAQDLLLYFDDREAFFKAASAHEKLCVAEQ